MHVKAGAPPPPPWTTPPAYLPTPRLTPSCPPAQQNAGADSRCTVAQLGNNPPVKHVKRGQGSRSPNTMH